MYSAPYYEDSALVLFLTGFYGPLCVPSNLLVVWLLYVRMNTGGTPPNYLNYIVAGSYYGEDITLGIVPGYFFDGVDTVDYKILLVFSYTYRTPLLRYIKFYGYIPQ